MDIQTLQILRTALPGVEHFIQETLAYESLSDSARIEWAVLIQHLTKLQHDKLPLHDCIASIKSEQSRDENALPTLLSTSTSGTVLDAHMLQTANVDTSQSNDMQIPVSSSVSHFETPSLDLSMIKEAKCINLNPLDIPRHQLLQSDLLVSEPTLNSIVSSDFLNPTDSANSEGGTNDSVGEQDNLDPSTLSRPHGCSYCPKRFMRKQHLRQHILVHTGNKPYHCSLCDRKFIYPSVLRDHLKLHITPPHSCSHCSQKFIHKKSYDKHMLTHKNLIIEKPFLCSECNKSYRTRWMLKAHMKKCHLSVNELTEVGSSNNTISNKNVLSNSGISHQMMKSEPIIIHDSQVL